MLIYNSMILWIGIMALLYSGFTKRNSMYLGYEKQTKVPLIFAVMTFGYIIFWAGVRSGVADTRTYIEMFNAYPSNLSDVTEFWNSDNKAPGFLLFNILFKSLVSSDYHLWLMTIAVISGICVMYVLYQKSEDFFYSAFLFVVTLNFFWMFNGIRQFLVAAILFALSDWIKERKTGLFILAVLLLSTVHYTAIVMIPMYWVATGKPFGKKIMLFIAVLLLCVIYIEPFIAALESSLADTGYSGFSEQFAMDDGVNPIRVLVMCVTPAVAFVGRKIIAKENDAYINICVNMSVISGGLYFIGMFTSGILVGRLPIYFELYNLVLLPYLIRNCFKKESSKVMYLLCALGFVVFYYLQMRGGYYISDITGLV